MAAYFRLQDLVIVNANKVQDLRMSIDIGAFRHLSVYVRKPIASVAGTLTLQTASVNEEDFYMDIAGATSTLSVAGSDLIVVSDPLRHLRWRTTAMNGSSQFLIDIIGRES
jgi:hypothetical protein